MTTTELSPGLSYNDAARLLISAAVTVVLLTEIDKVMSGETLYSAVRPLIAGYLLCVACKSTSVEPAG